MPASLIGEVYLLNQGMKNFDMSKVTPIFRSSIVINSVLCGGIIYNEFSTFSSLQTSMFALGVFCCLVGIGLILVGARDNRRPTGTSFMSQDSSDSLTTDT